MLATRQHANLRLDIWGNDDWRALTRDEQWFYELLISHPRTTRAGVCDWIPGRLAQMAAGTTPQDIEAISAALVEKWFIVIDYETQEVAVRTYVKHDGLLKQPNMTTTMANDWAGIASPFLRAVIAFEVQKLRRDEPELSAWKNKRVQTILTADAVDAKTQTLQQPKALPIGLPIDLPIAKGMGLGSDTSTSTSTATPPSKEGGGTPTPFCKLHPDGTEKPCRGCKLAGTAYEKWVAEIEAGEAALKTNTAPVVVNEAYCSQHEFFPMPCDRCREERDG